MGEEMTRENQNLVILMIVIAVLTGVLTSVKAETYYVGDSIGWAPPPNGAVAYVNWAAQHSFAVADVLVFNFTTGRHNVAKVTSGNFNSCNINSPVSLQTNGPANFTLDSEPQQFFICTFSTHCSLGQKLQINLNSLPPGSSPNPSTPPPPRPPPPPRSSASRAAIATFSLILSYMAMTYLLC